MDPLTMKKSMKSPLSNKANKTNPILTIQYAINCYFSKIIINLYELVNAIKSKNLRFLP